MSLPESVLNITFTLSWWSLLSFKAHAQTTRLHSRERLVEVNVAVVWQSHLLKFQHHPFLLVMYLVLSEDFASKVSRIQGVEAHE